MRHKCSKIKYTKDNSGIYTTETTLTNLTHMQPYIHDTILCGGIVAYAMGNMTIVVLFDSMLNQRKLVELLNII